MCSSIIVYPTTGNGIIVSIGYQSIDSIELGHYCMNCFNVVFMVFPLKSKAYIHANVFYLENTLKIQRKSLRIVMKLLKILAIK